MPWPSASAARTASSMSPDRATSGDRRFAVTRGRPSTASAGKSHSWVTATSRSSSPSAQTISVAEGSNETIRRAGSLQAALAGPGRGRVRDHACVWRSGSSSGWRRRRARCTTSRDRRGVGVDLVDHLRDQVIGLVLRRVALGPPQLPALLLERQEEVGIGPHAHPAPAAAPAALRRPWAGRRTRTTALRLLRATAGGRGAGSARRRTTRAPPGARGSPPAR